MYFLHRILADTRFALRLVRRSPVFSATLLLVLMIGIGATTAMFSLVMSLFVRPLPYPHAEDLTMVWRMPGWNPASIPDFLDWRAQASTFSGMAAIEYDSVSLSSEGAKPEHLPGANVSGDFFPMLGISPLRGRLLGPDDDRVGGPRVAVVSAAVWHGRFGSDPGLVGRAIRLNGEPYTVVGIAPEGFRFSGPRSERSDLWTPLAVTRHAYATESVSARDSHFLHVIGRRKPGVSIEQAQVQLSAIAAGLEAAYPESNTNKGIFLRDLHDELVASSRDGVWVLFAAVGLVFLVVCANVANLLLARATARRSEIAARAALGATRGRLIAQLLTETLVVFVLGALGGALLAHWLVALFADGLVYAGAATIDIRVDGAALGFAIGTALVCGLVFGLVPAREASRVSPQAVLKESSARTSMGRSQRIVRAGLVTAQVALAFVLLAGSGIALRAFAKVASTPPGFDPENLATARLSLAEAKYEGKDDLLLAFYRDAEKRIAAYPGVGAVAYNSALPMAGSNWNGSFAIEGRAPWRAGSAPNLERNIVTPGYFRTMGIPVLRGREFEESDVAGGRNVMVISLAAAEHFFPNEDPIGHRIDWGDRDERTGGWREIVGIVGDVRKRGLAGAVVPESYCPLTQHPVRWVSVVARNSRPEALMNDLPAIVAAVDPEQAISSRQLMADRVAGTVGSERFVTTLLGAFAAAALLLATLGIFGLVSYTTTQRTRELGIRIALGASPERVIAVVMREGLRLLALGLVLGLFGALVVARAMAARVHGAAALDPALFATILGVLFVAGTAASLLPAIRAVRISPASALRYE